MMTQIPCYTYCCNLLPLPSFPESLLPSCPFIHPSDRPCNCTNGLLQILRGDHYLLPHILHLLSGIPPPLICLLYTLAPFGSPLLDSSHTPGLHLLKDLQPWDHFSCPPVLAIWETHQAPPGECHLVSVHNLPWNFVIGPALDLNIQLLTQHLNCDVLQKSLC